MVELKCERFYPDVARFESKKKRKEKQFLKQKTSLKLSFKFVVEQRFFCYNICRSLSHFFPIIRLLQCSHFPLIFIEFIILFEPSVYKYIPK